MPLRGNQAAHLDRRGAVEQAFDRRYKLYSTGEFYDTDRDPEEAAPLPLADLTGEAADAARTLRSALDRFRDARPADASSNRVALVTQIAVYRGETWRWQRPARRLRSPLRPCAPKRPKKPMLPYLIAPGPFFPNATPWMPGS